MKPTIIFLAGFCVPISIMKSKWLFDDSMWKGYRRIWLPSRTPLSDVMVEKELDRLEKLAWMYPQATWVGHSLGGWWASNLALRPIEIRKLALWTPLCNEQEYPIFNVTPRYHPCNQPVTFNFGIEKVRIFSAKDDLIVPPNNHSYQLARHFTTSMYGLDGGHFYQSNHKLGLFHMKDWIESV